MELKNYQKKVIEDIALYLAFLEEKRNLNNAWNSFWNSKGIYVGLGGQPLYNDNLPNTPHVCVKAGTGSGKTFMAVSAVKPIFDFMPSARNKLVVWLVPSDSILTQTVAALKNVNHPYRERLNRDFGGRVEVYTKDELLNGQRFSPDTVMSQLSLCVMSFSSLRIDSNKRDIRKAYQENGNLKNFTNYFSNKEVLLADTPDTALMQVIRQLSPVTIVDESHNASSKLSIEMLKNLNPSFVLDLTATPRQESNILSFVDPRDVKKENMVKLPVVVYKRAGRQSVFSDAIQLRGCLEKIAKADRVDGGDYIRPIILFQAQPRIHEESVTFDKIKQTLISFGIKEEEIAIKTSDINELKNVDLLSEECPIRYIITVNALKEGWDCSFAYILASLANKTSNVDVEQILGRILRQPYARKQCNHLLNTSYVLTCSDDFHSTLESVVKGLNAAGFSEDDYRVGTYYEPEIQTASDPQQPEGTIGVHDPEPIDELRITDSVDQPDNFDDINISEVKQQIEESHDTEHVAESIQEIMNKAEEESKRYDDMMNNANDGILAPELEDIIKRSKIKDSFKESVVELKIPQFFLSNGGEEDLFGSTEALLEPIALSEDIELRNMDARVDLSLSTDDMFRVDIVDDDKTPKYMKLSRSDAKKMHEMLSSLAPETRKNQLIERIVLLINRRSQYDVDDVREYVKKIIGNLSNDEMIAVESSAEICASKIQNKINGMESEYRKDMFLKLLASEEIICKPEWKFPKEINPMTTTNLIDKSLYSDEDANMNNFEKDVIATVASLENVVWWHRNIDRKGFKINGFINHYPDFIIMTKQGKCILLESKGEHLDNDVTSDKILLGSKWESKAGPGFRYFLVFPNRENIEQGAYNLDGFIDILKRL